MAPNVCSGYKVHNLRQSRFFLSSEEDARFAGCSLDVAIKFVQRNFGELFGLNAVGAQQAEDRLRGSIARQDLALLAMFGAHRDL
jgi:hypothetical protein